MAGGKYPTYRVLAKDAVDAAGARVEAERESQHQPDDLSADAARLGAADVRGWLSGR